MKYIILILIIYLIYRFTSVKKIPPHVKPKEDAPIESIDIEYEEISTKKNNN